MSDRRNMVAYSHAFAGVRQGKVMLHRPTLDDRHFGFGTYCCKLNSAVTYDVVDTTNRWVHTKHVRLTTPRKKLHGIRTTKNIDVS